MAFLDAPVLHRLRNRRLLVLALMVSAMVLVGQASNARPPSAASSPYTVSLEDEHGNVLRTFRREGTTFVLGYLGERYNVRIENHGDRRVEAVLSVDGRDAVSGDAGDFVHGRGYLVPAHGSVVVDGFRQSLDQAAAFRFSHPSSSYSARRGTPENVGVIGVAFFAERRAWHPRPPVQAPYYEDDRWHGPPGPSRSDDEQGSAPASREGGASRGADARQAPRGEPAPRDAAKSADSASADLGGAAPARRREASAPSRLGTEYGESTWSPVTEVPFQRQDPWHPDAVASLRYDDADGLIARGIDVYPRPYWPEYRASEPEPFPRSRFAPAPW
jgi:hypothetical protein